MRTFIVVASALLCAAPAFAEEHVGCDKFKWPIAPMQAALTAPGLAKVTSGAEIAGASPSAAIGLRPLAEAALPKPPERSQKPETFAGFVRILPVSAGTYTISLSDGAWVDVVQNDGYLKPKAFSGATGCNGIRKSVKFELGAAPVIIQVSDVARDSIRIAVMPAAD